jgi:hypothetical protein
MSLLGLPDMGFISLPELAMVTRHVVNCVNAPVIADAIPVLATRINVLRQQEKLSVLERRRCSSRTSLRQKGAVTWR